MTVVSSSGAVRIKISGARGARGLSSGPLGEGSVDAETITNESTEKLAILNKLLLSSSLAGEGSALLGHLAPGDGGRPLTLFDSVSRVVHEQDYFSYAEAKVQAGNSLPLFASPKTNSSFEGAKTRPGLITGHMVIGDTDAIKLDPDAYVGLLADELYSGDIQQEMRGVSYTIRYDRSTADEPVLGWDVIPVLGATVVGPDNAHDLLGNMKGCVGELIFQQPTSGPRTIRNAYNLQATTYVEEDVTITNWYGVAVGEPIHNGVNGGTITNAFGLFINNIAGGGVTLTNPAAIRIAGSGNAGRIWWGNNTWISGDSSGKLELSANGYAISLLNAKTSTGATAGGGAALPATVGGYLSVLIGGVERKIPYFAA